MALICDMLGVQGSDSGYLCSCVVTRIRKGLSSVGLMRAAFLASTSTLPTCWGDSVFDWTPKNLQLPEQL
jgi:hypothetical protein